MKNRIAAVGLAAAVALTGGIAAAGTSASASADDKPRIPRAVAKQATVTACPGGASINTRTHSATSQAVPGNTTVNVAGGSLKIKGPKRGADTVVVTFSAFAFASAGDLMYVGLTKDGNNVNPGPKYFAYNGEYDQGSTQFCTRIGPGWHWLRVRATESGSGGGALYYPTTTFQRFA